MSVAKDHGQAILNRTGQLQWYGRRGSHPLRAAQEQIGKTLSEGGSDFDSHNRGLDAVNNLVCGRLLTWNSSDEYLPQVLMFNTQNPAEQQDEWLYWAILSSTSNAAASGILSLLLEYRPIDLRRPELDLLLSWMVLDPKYTMSLDTLFRYLEGRGYKKKAYLKFTDV